MRLTPAALALLALFASSLPPARAAEPAPGSDLAGRRAALAALVAEQWEYTLSTSPEFASFLGDKRWNDKLSDFSEARASRRTSPKTASSWRASKPSTRPAFRSRRRSTRR